jgi:hypothetical protein
MLIIREAQVAALAVAVFERRLYEHLRDSFPARCAAMPRGAVLESIRAAIVRARGHGFSEDGHVAQFVVMAFAAGLDFDLHPAAAEVLADERLRERRGIQMMRLLEAVNERFRPPGDA